MLISRHETPLVVSELLAKYAPKRLQRVLDPSTGNGVLIKPFLRANPQLDATCIDVDAKVTRPLRGELRSYPNAQVITSDFLSWSKAKRRKSYDCVVMNPPFAARKKSLVELEFRLDGLPRQKSFVAVEIAFVVRAVALLRPGGRLLAILPASVISSESGMWLRCFLLKGGRIRLVHELPSRTFSGVDGKMFIFIYEHGTSQGQVALRNHRLSKPDELIISRAVAEQTVRFDYAFHESRVWYEKVQSICELQWTELNKAARCWRGEVASPVRDSDVLHTTNMFTFKPDKRMRATSERCVRPGDLVVKRVSRNCSGSWAPYRGKASALCSDCILILRPRENVDALSLLFALRVIFGAPLGASLLESGMGASYITLSSLAGVKIPLGLAQAYPQEFEEFKTALRTESWQELPQIEAGVLADLNRQLLGMRRDAGQGMRDIHDR